MDTPELQPEESSLPEPAAADKPAKPERQETVWETLRSLLIVLVGVLCIRTFVAEATVIPTGSMESTILVGDHVFLNKLLYGPRLPSSKLRTGLSFNFTPKSRMAWVGSIKVRPT